MSADIVEAIKTAFKGKPITITVEVESDTTAYLMSNASNKAFLKRSLDQAARGELVEVDIREEEG